MGSVRPRGSMLSWAGMLGWTRDLGRIRALGVGPVLSVGLCLAGCSLSSSTSSVGAPFETGSASGGADSGPPIAAGGPSTGGAVGFAGSTGTGTSSSQLSCAPAVAGTSAPVFTNQVLSFAAPSRAELYSWITDDDATALRASRQLFPPLAEPSFTSLALQALTHVSDPLTAQLATSLSGPEFANGRLAWPEPWAIHTTIAGADPGRNLLRVVLKPEAWVAVIKDGDVQVVDQQNQTVAPADAAATPARIGAVLHVHDSGDGGPDCSLVPGADVGYREFVVGNADMIQEWSLGTQLIRDRLSANIDQLTEFFNRTRACPNEVSPQFWNQDVVCSWDAGIFDMSEESAYQEALAIPNDDYATSPPELAALIAKLQGDLFEIDPLVVTPGSP